MSASCILWLIHDGKAGHRSQLEGLRAALAERVELTAHWLEPLSPAHALWECARGRTRLGAALPAPHFIAVAGHRTHWSGLAARRAYGGRLIALMRPSLPLSWFDAAIVPEHDQCPPHANVLQTAGVLNPMRPAHKIPGSAIALLGGESRHFGWSDEAVLAVLDHLCVAWPRIIVADSRRTPASLRAVLAERHGPTWQPWEDCPPGWLAATLARTETAWVTADSVSMVYEALSAGCATALMPLPPARRPSKLTCGIIRLIQNGQVSDFPRWHHGQPLRPPATPLAEAARAADWLLARFPLATWDAR